MPGATSQHVVAARLRGRESRRSRRLGFAGELDLAPRARGSSSSRTARRTISGWPTTSGRQTGVDRRIGPGADDRLGPDAGRIAQRDWQYVVSPYFDSSRRAAAGRSGAAECLMADRRPSGVARAALLSSFFPRVFDRDTYFHDAGLVCPGHDGRHADRGPVDRRPAHESLRRTCCAGRPCIV